MLLSLLGAKHNMEKYSTIHLLCDRIYGYSEANVRCWLNHFHDSWVISLSPSFPVRNASFMQTHELQFQNSLIKKDKTQFLSLSEAKLYTYQGRLYHDSCSKPMCVCHMGVFLPLANSSS